MNSETMNEEKEITFPVSLEELPNAELLESADFNSVSYINSLFPTEQSLCNLEAVSARCEYRASCVATEMRALVRGAARGRETGHAALQEAQRTIAQLSEQVLEINKKAERSEVMVREITAEIKQLDAAKTNLTAAITALNHYHMLVGGATALTRLTNDRLYREIVLPLQACTEVLQHFESYKDIHQISELRDSVTHIRSTLGQQILADFKEAFTGSKSNFSPRTLADACLVVDALDVKVKNELIKWLVDVELQEYQHLFSPSEESSWLDRIERRYSWLKRHLLAFEESRAKIFPQAWDLSTHIATHFCKITQTELSSIMAARRSYIDVKLLLYAIQKTYNFELLLHKRFEGTVPPENVPPSSENADTEETESNIGKSPWVGAIGSCFEPYLSLYITSLESNLRQLMDTFIQDAKQSSTSDSSTDNNAGNSLNAGGEVLSSCADLFVFYKKCLVQCAQLSTGQPMKELSLVFGSYLREYANSVLQASLPRTLGLREMPSTVPALVTNLQSLLSDNVVRYNESEISKITSVLTTSEYCLETTLHLQNKLKEKINSSLKEQVNLSGEQELFQKIISDCIQMLVRDLEAGCSSALTSMVKIEWGGKTAVGDQSAFVSALCVQLRTSVPPLRARLASTRKYFTQLCIRFVNSFIPNYIQHLYKCKPMSTAGAEQLLLDTHMLKSCLLELPIVGTTTPNTGSRGAPAAYTRAVLRLCGKAEMLLKLVLAPLEMASSGPSLVGAEGFVSQFVQLVPECTLTEFHRVLDMKGLKLSKSQTQSLDAMFREHSRARAAALDNNK